MLLLAWPVFRKSYSNLIHWALMRYLHRIFSSTQKGILAWNSIRRSKRQFSTCLCMLRWYFSACFANKSNNNKEWRNKRKWCFESENSSIIFAVLKFVPQNLWASKLKQEFWDFEFFPKLFPAKYWVIVKRLMIRKTVLSAKYSSKQFGVLLWGKWPRRLCEMWQKESNERPDDSLSLRRKLELFFIYIHWKYVSRPTCEGKVMYYFKPYL